MKQWIGWILLLWPVAIMLFQAVSSVGLGRFCLIVASTIVALASMVIGGWLLKGDFE